MRALFVSLFCLLAVWCAPQEAQAQAIVLPCVPSGTSCIPVSAANPLPTTGAASSIISGTTLITGSCTNGYTLYNNNGVVGCQPTGTITSATTSYCAIYSGAITITGYAGCTYTDPGQLALTLGTITSNLKGLSITGTWNASGTVFDAPLFMNIIPTASAAGSLLADIQVSGTRMFALSANGLAVGPSAVNNSAFPVEVDFTTTNASPANVLLNNISTGASGIQIINSHVSLANAWQFFITNDATPKFKIGQNGVADYLTILTSTGNATFSGTIAVNSTDATSISTGAIQNPGGMSVNKRVWFNGITASAGLQTAVLCQSSGGEVIADSVACLASSREFKENFSSLPNSLARNVIDKLVPMSWSYKHESGSIFPQTYYRERIGFVAEDVAEIDPRLVEIDTAGKPRAIDYNGLVSLLTKRVAELGNSNDTFNERLKIVEMKQHSRREETAK